ncbi:NAD(P)-binding domain-containing protein [Streptomyces sp. NPDC052036]|uniref:NAD(P)-dependent oxidoreductase n=1 Tax=Streptomyces sp. NPDC052036 TaxID=3155171 RepID=UPI003422A87B
MIEASDEQTRLIPVTVLGLGPMGRALAPAFLEVRHPVTVWNRTPGKAGDLIARGAMAANSVQDAVRAGQVIIACLIDYDAVRATLEPSQADWENRWLVNLTSGEPAQARQMSQWTAARGFHYLDGAILTPSSAIGTSSAAVLFSGARDVYEAVQETMAAVGGTAVHLSDDPGQASAYEVALLDNFATSVNGIVHAFALASAEGIEPDVVGRAGPDRRLGGGGVGARHAGADQERGRQRRRDCRCPSPSTHGDGSSLFSSVDEADQDAPRPWGMPIPVSPSQPAPALHSSGLIPGYSAH